MDKNAIQSLTQAMGIAAQLRLIAELLEKGDMLPKSGSIEVQSTYDGNVFVKSDIAISCVKQPVVDETHTEEIVLFGTEEQEVFDVLDRLDPGERKAFSFDVDEKEKCNLWIRTVKNRGTYPEYLKGRVFEVHGVVSRVDSSFTIERLL